ncbi:MAG: hypothetical protein QOG72_3103, partial [Sphingomonadales bacterium]|nr:hypothetical protein [Sphingomonadales bacterium]
MNIEGTNAAETLNGTGDADAISGNDGNDILNGLGGDDVLRGGRGVDGFDGGADDMSADPTSRGDAISFFERAATQGAVADLRTGTISSDGFGNAETMTGIESIVGDTAFADTFYGNDNGNALSGSLGDTLYGFGGDDVVSLNAAPAVADGGAGNDTLVLQGGGGWLLPDGDGDGLAELASEWGIGWYVDLGSGTVEHEFFYDYGYVQGFENVIGSHMSDFIVGDGGANAVHGGGGRDSILGEGGDDHLFGDEGNDFLMGGAGVDRFDGGADDPLDPIAADLDKIGFADVFATQAAVADLRDGTISNDGYGNVETMVNIEGIAGGTAYADSFYGNDGANLLAVGRGDTVYGFGGNDRIYLSAAPALVDGGAGDDRLQLDSGGGWLLPDSDGDGIAQVAGATPFGWQVDLGSGTLTDGYGNSGSVGGFETVIGSARDDRLYGGSGADVLEGSGGDDELLGRGGDDILRGDDGNDRLDGGAGADRMTGRAGDDVYGVDSLADIVEEYAGEGTDEVRTSLDGYSLLGTQIENLTATTDGPHDLRGGAGDNVVTGAAGNDLLRLNDGGNDSAFGGGGNDVLYFGGAFTG